MTYPVRAYALIIENDLILLIEFEDENGIHYNLPAGGIEENKSFFESVKRKKRQLLTWK